MITAQESLALPETIPQKSFEVEFLYAVHDRLKKGQVEEGMMELLPALQERRLDWQDRKWAQFVGVCLDHPLRGLLHKDPFTCRAFAKPRGYPGDAPLLDFIYGREEGWPVPEETSELGRALFEFTTRSSACEAVRARRGFIADMVSRLVDEIPRAHILAVAAGHLREALLCSAVKRQKFGRYVALDSDNQSLEEISRCYGRFGIEPTSGTIRQLLTDKCHLGTFDFIHSTGLFDYLALPSAQRLTWVMFQMLRPRGRLLVANFLPGIPDIGYMESYMAWKLLFRSRYEMLQLAEEIRQDQIRDLRIFAEENQNIIFMEVTKR